ncbi:MAG TPA: extracellular solute-binding protein [Tepidisphaeraceae bacterium]|nr:extracellular solute-binding protein [Tepidisphaeraceae bacterium]
MSFPLGKPILVMTFVALISGAWVATCPSKPQADLVLWTFVESHANTYRSIIEQFEKQTGKTVDIQLVSPKASVVRLESMFMSGQTGRILPDLVEMEIGDVGRFFLPPADQVGFLPLNNYLSSGDWQKRIVPTRFAPWSKGDVIFGVPHDVHPVSITYRKDLFDQAGVDLESSKTWPAFLDACLKFQVYWQEHDQPQRHAMDLKQTAPDYLIIMLLQRHVNLIDEHNEIHINDPIVTKTLAYYAQLVAGPTRIGWEGSTNRGAWVNDIVEGNLCAFFTPDWRIYDLQTYGSQLHGKLQMMPLPRFEPSDAPTSTWGGTMIAITRQSRSHDDAWKLLEFLYLSQTGHEAGMQFTTTIPPVMEWWNNAAYHQSDAFFGGQKINELYVDLARQIPPRYVNPATLIAQIQLSVVLNLATNYVESQGIDGLEQACQKWLDFAASDLKARIRNGRIDE